MPKGSRGYFKNLDPYAGPLKPENPEFEAQVRARMGSPFTPLVDPAMAAYIGPDSQGMSLRGFFAPGGVSPESQLRSLESFGMDSVGREGKQVFGVGKGATPQVWAHEFRHREVKDEFSNRMKDVAYSASQQAYQQNVRTAHDYLVRQGRAEDRGYTFEEKEKAVLRLMPVYVDESRNLIQPYVNRNQGNPSYLDQVLGVTLGDRMERKRAAEQSRLPFLLWAGKDSRPPVGHNRPVSAAREETPPRTREVLR